MKLFPLRILFLLATAGVLTGCGIWTPRHERTDSPAGFWLFVEPDAWWQMQAPRSWTPLRIELDGAVTSLSAKPRKIPSPAKSPLIDPLSTEVVYAFRPQDGLDRCNTPCPAGQVPEIAIVARPRLPEAVTDAARRLADSLDSGIGVTAIDTPCPKGLECAAISVETFYSRTWITLVDAPSQQRTYEIKTSAPLDTWPSFEPLFTASLSSFEVLR